MVTNPFLSRIHIKSPPFIKTNWKLSSQTQRDRSASNASSSTETTDSATTRTPSYDSFSVKESQEHPYNHSILLTDVSQTTYSSTSSPPRRTPVSEKNKPESRNTFIMSPEVEPTDYFDIRFRPTSSVAPGWFLEYSDQEREAQRALDAAVRVLDSHFAGSSLQSAWSDSEDDSDDAFDDENSGEDDDAFWGSNLVSSPLPQGIALNLPPSPPPRSPLPLLPFTEVRPIRERSSPTPLPQELDEVPIPIAPSALDTPYNVIRRWSAAF
ncbi:hypothetical protein T439DRAFT_322543 [Meredithblackwellia eburnea MCA 4105]